MIRKKVCVLGAVAVGKTSLLRRFVHGIFSEDYQSTIGVKIDNKTVEQDDEVVELVLWDLDGHADFDRVRGRYLQGCNGYLMIVDGTRPETLDAAFDLRDSVQEVADFPAVWMLNKVDLAEEWKLDSDVEKKLAKRGLEVLSSSAKSGQGVEQAFRLLTARMLATS